MALFGTVPAAPNQNRSTLGKYQLIASLGQGGMAKVFLSLVSGPAGVNKLMVVKVLKSEMLHGLEGGIDLFWDEARLATRLLHPNIVHTYEVGEIDGHYFLAMEYLDGQIYRVLQARTAQDRLPLEEELRILSEVARGLHYAHELRDYRGVPLGVVHRDVSPQNVFVTYDGQVKLIDFGIAKTRDAGHETRVGLIKGKLNYIAPEQLRGDPLDRRADIFALGVMLWEAIAGLRFAGGASVAEVTKVHARIKGEEPNIRSVKPDVPEELAAIVDRAIALDREQRWTDAAAFADALDAYMESQAQRPSAKTLAARMQALFEKDRESLHKVIDARMQSILHGTFDESVQDLPTLPMAEELHTSSGSMSGRSAAFRASDPNASQATGLRVKQRETRWSKLALWSGGAGAAAVVVAVLALGSPKETAGDPSQAGTMPSSLPPPLDPTSLNAPAQGALPAAAAEPAAPSELAVAHVTLALTVEPDDAVVLIDGAQVKAPFTGSFPKSNALHRVEVTARGYRPFVRLIPFDQDHKLEVALEPYSEPGRKTSAARTRPGERHASPSAPNPQEEVRPATSEEPAKPAVVVPGADIRSTRHRVGQGQIDTADPYSNGN